MTCVKELGDWQTPLELAAAVCALLRFEGVEPRCVLEPTCGKGAFVRAALETWPESRVYGLEIQREHLNAALAAIPPDRRCHVSLLEGNVFDPKPADWPIGSDVLVLGNPPWITSAALGALGSANVPAKRNRDGAPGLDALTGKANFDLAEAVVLRMLEEMKGRGTLAMLVKMKTAQHVLARFLPGRRGSACLRRFDAAGWFGASVEACLLLIRFDRTDAEVPVYTSLSVQATAEALLGWDGDRLVDRYREAGDSGLGTGAGFPWRPGVKHDAARVLELTRLEDGVYLNGLGESVEIEDVAVFPLLKSSDLANDRLVPVRAVLLPQRSTVEDTTGLRTSAPQTYSYLQHHGEVLDGRRSSIYRNRPRFAIFGVGDYTFALWKVAVSGLYANFNFVAVGPFQGRPVVFDDTVNLLACQSREEAEEVATHFNSPSVQSHLRARCLPRAKRPLTIDLLRSVPRPGRLSRELQPALL